MNKEIIFDNLEILRKYLGKNMQEFSVMFDKEQSYYRKIIRSEKRIPSLDFIVQVCEYCHIKIDRFLNEKLELQLVFENDKDLHSRETEIKGEQ